MLPLLYHELVPWYRLLDQYADHLDEATSYKKNFLRVNPPENATLLDLGAGAGNNAYHLVDRFSCTLVDLSPAMSQLSRELLPQCEQIIADMRTVRLERTFDAVLVHDAIAYMTNAADLQKVIETAFVHTRPGGAALFAPDCVRENFRERTDFFESADGTRSMRGIEWVWDPDPDDGVYMAEYAFLLRDGTEMRSVHDRHVEGLFSRDKWFELLRGAGYSVELVQRPLDDDGEFDEVFFCTR